MMQTNGAAQFASLRWALLTDNALARGLHLEQLALLYADAKVAEFDVAVIVQQHVRALHVRMDHPGAVQEFQALDALPERLMR